MGYLSKFWKTEHSKLKCQPFLCSSYLTWKALAVAMAMAVAVAAWLHSLILSSHDPVLCISVSCHLFMRTTVIGFRDHTK